MKLFINSYLANFASDIHLTEYYTDFLFLLAFLNDRITIKRTT